MNMAKIRNFVSNNKKKLLVSFLIGVTLSGLIPLILISSSFISQKYTISEELEGIGILYDRESTPLGLIIQHIIFRSNDAIMKFLCDFGLGGEERIYSEEEENARILSSQSKEEVLNPPFIVGQKYYVCGDGIINTTSELLIAGLSAFINIFIISFIFMYSVEKIIQKNKS